MLIASLTTLVCVIFNVYLRTDYIDRAGGTDVETNVDVSLFNCNHNRIPGIVVEFS